MRDSDPVVTPQRFPIRIGRRSQLVLLLFGVRPANAYVDLGGDELDAHFGFFRFRTPTSNLASWRIEGPWRWITAIGVRFSVRDHDLTFGGTNRGGVRVDFREPVSHLGVRVPALYLTVEDIEGLAAALAERGLPGTDTRKPARLPPPAMPDAGPMPLGRLPAGLPRSDSPTMRTERSHDVLAALKDLKETEARKRKEPISTPRFHELAEEVTPPSKGSPGNETRGPAW